MTVTVAQATSLLESVLFEQPAMASADAAGWVATSSSATGIGGLASAMAVAPEAGIAAEVIRLYLGALGRSPAAAEVQYYVNVAEAGLSSAQIASGVAAVPLATWDRIADDFVNSPEFTSAASGTTLVTLLYQNILGRTPSASEVSYYQNALNAGANAGILLQDFINSPEYLAKVGAAISAQLAANGAETLAGTPPLTLNELVLAQPNVNGGTYTAASLGSALNQFSSLGVADAGANADSYDMHTVFSGFTTIDVIAASAVSDSFTNVAAGTTLQIEGNAASISFIFTPASTQASIGVILGNAATTGTTGLTVATLSLNDVSNDGVATLSVTALNASGGADVITTLSDTALSTLIAEGDGGVTIGTLAVTVPVLSIDNGAAGATTVGTLTDSNLANLRILGTDPTTITTLNVGTETDLVITNAGSAALTIGTLSNSGGLDNLTLSGAAPIAINNLAGMTGASITIAYTGTALASIDTQGGASFADANVTSLVLYGNVALNGSGAAAAATGATTGFTLAAGTDNAAINLTLSGAASGSGDTVVVGDGNNLITDLSTAGSVKVTVGSGSNVIDIHSGNSSGFSATVDLGSTPTSSTGSDSILVSVTSASATTPNTTIVNALPGDLILIADGSAVATLTAAQQAAIDSLATLSSALTYVDGGTLALAANTAVAFQFDGQTYIVESHAAGTGTLTANDTFIELAGIHSLSSLVNGHHFTVAS